jgi:uncharacterized protein YcnI
MKNLSALLLAALLAPAAMAHIAVAPATAAAGGYQKLTFSVGHGCKGSPTTGISIALPEGVAGAKPMPKPGWVIATDGRSISWKGGALPDAYFDEFAMQVKLPATPGKLYFKIVQLCEQGRHDWVELPQPGVQSTSPAAMIDVTPAAEAAHQH